MRRFKMTDKSREWLIELRNGNGMTQKELAAQVGISRSHYAEIETGVKNPGGMTAKKIADVLGFDMVLFFEENCRIKRQIKPLLSPTGTERS